MKQNAHFSFQKFALRSYSSYQIGSKIDLLKKQQMQEDLDYMIIAQSLLQRFVQGEEPEKMEEEPVQKGILPYFLKLLLEEKNKHLTNKFLDHAQDVLTKKLKIDEKTIEEIDKFDQTTEKLSHCEAPIYNIILSSVELICSELSIPKQNILQLVKNFQAWKLFEKTEDLIMDINLPEWPIDPEALKQGVINLINQAKGKENENYWNFQIKGCFYYLLNQIYGVMLALQDTWTDKEESSKILELIQNKLLKDKYAKMAFSDFDVKFWSRLIQSYLLYRKAPDVYYEPTQDPQCGLVTPFKSNEKVALLGDWGSGLRDAFDLIDHLVIKKGVTCVVHLGDVYYAGFPYEFKRISDHLASLRAQGHKFRYYTVPGNHDYYTKGGPFFQHLKLVNQNPEDEQKHSFFCLRDQNSKVQFLGVDTGKNEHQIITHLSPHFEGCHLEEKQLEWAKKRINQFPGQTILLSHHPLFTAYDAIIGRKTQYGKMNQQNDAKLSKQLFDVIPKLSCWYWGHEHRCVKYVDWAYGAPRCRMVGNSSFEINNKGVYMNYNAYQVTFDKINIVDPLFEPQIVNEFYNHTATIFEIEGDQIRAEYIEMTASYNELSIPGRQFSEYFTKIDLSPIKANSIYCMKQSCGLSLFLEEQHNGLVWLNCVPSKITFEKIDGEAGFIKKGEQYRIKVSNDGNNWRYLSIKKEGTIDLLEGTQEDLNETWQIVSSQDRNEICIGDTIRLQHKSSGHTLASKFLQSFYGITTENQQNDGQALFQIYPEPKFMPSQ